MVRSIRQGPNVCATIEVKKRPRPKPRPARRAKKTAGHLASPAAWIGQHARQPHAAEGAEALLIPRRRVAQVGQVGQAAAVRSPVGLALVATRGRVLAALLTRRSEGDRRLAAVRPGVRAILD